METSVRLFSLANFQAFFASQVFFKNFECECSAQNVLEATKIPFSDILLKCYYNLTENGNIKSAASFNTELLHRYSTSY